MNTQQFQELDRFFSRNDIKGAESYLTDLLHAAAAQKELPLMLSVSNELGGIFRVTNRLSEAAKLYLSALEMISVLHLEQTVSHGTTLLNYAGVLAESGEFQKALDLYKQAEVIYDRLGIQDAYQRAALSNNISHMLDKLNQNQEALGYAKESLELILALPGAEVEKATSYATLAARQMKVGNIHEATNNVLESERIFTSLSGPLHPHYAGALNTKGELYCKTGKTQEAEAAFRKALEVVESSQGKNQAYDKIQENLYKLTSGIPPQKHSRRSGMEMAKAFYLDAGLEMIQSKFPRFEKDMAIGLVGEGSECFGFDDEYSESHDFGPGFCIWLPAPLYREIGTQLQSAYEQLELQYGSRRNETLEGKGRVGVHSIPDFYHHYTGLADGPKQLVDWFKVPEQSIATITNGQVFQDPQREFSRIRQSFLDYYPKDVLLKKIAARFAVMAQSGQYNYQRSIQRMDFPAAYLACSEFVKAAASLVFLLNRQFMPFYKWTFRSMEKLSRGRGMMIPLQKIMAGEDMKQHAANKIQWIEEVCAMALAETNQAGWTNGQDAFLNNHCPHLMNQIQDPVIRNLPVMYDAR